MTEAPERITAVCRRWFLLGRACWRCFGRWECSYHGARLIKHTRASSARVCARWASLINRWRGDRKEDFEAERCRRRSVKVDATVKREMRIVCRYPRGIARKSEVEEQSVLVLKAECIHTCIHFGGLGGQEISFFAWPTLASGLVAAIACASTMMHDDSGCGSWLGSERLIYRGLLFYMED